MTHWVGAFEVVAGHVAADNVVATVTDDVTVVVASKVAHARSSVKVLNAETTKVA